MTVATYAAAQLLRVLPRARITRAVGRLVDFPLPPAVSNAVVGIYARAYRVNMQEAQIDGAFESFDAFFTRSLKEGARRVDAPEGAIVSPSDGRVEARGPVEAGGQIQVKGKPYTVVDLVGDPADAARYTGGQFAVVYLSPRDYHRVHAPVAGRVTTIRSYEGDYYPVNAIGERHVPQLFSRNRRVAIPIHTETHGLVTVVMVAAMIVGRISVSGIPERDVPFGVLDLDAPLDVARGDEIGIFHLGSTAVLFVEPGRAAPFDVPIGSVRMGQQLAMGGAS